MDLKTCLYVGFALYTIFVIYVGFIGSKKIKGLSDFAVASESMGPISLGLAFAASFFSAATFLGYVGYAYAWGASALSSNTSRSHRSMPPCCGTCTTCP